jgi:hypothetical protein
MTAPIWIKVDDGEIFEGHQGHWADTFFANATKSAILWAGKEDPYLHHYKIEIRPMTPDELARYPEAVEFQKWLVEEYGEC